MAQTVPSDPGYPGFGDHWLEPRPIVESLLVPISIHIGAVLAREQTLRSFPTAMEHGLDGRECVGVQMYGAGVAVLCLVQINRATVPIELAHFDGVLFAEPHTGVDCCHVLG